MIRWCYGQHRDSPPFSARRLKKELRRRKVAEATMLRGGWYQLISNPEARWPSTFYGPRRRACALLSRADIRPWLKSRWRGIRSFPEEEEGVVQGKCLLPLGLSNFSETRNLFHSPGCTGEGIEEKKKKKKGNEGGWRRKDNLRETFVCIRLSLSPSIRYETVSFFSPYI